MHTPIEVVDVQTGAVRTVAQSKRVAMEPDWGQNGLIAFSSHYGDDVIEVVRPDGSGLRQLAPPKG